MSDFCKRRCRITLLVLFGLIPITVSASDLHIRVSGIDTDLGGMILAGVYASEEGYLEPGYQVASISLAVTGETLNGVFKDLPTGRYVVAILHDIDEDTEMNTGFLGIPKEGYGFSGAKKGRMRPPKFDDAAILLGENDEKSADIFMNYM